MKNNKLILISFLALAFPLVLASFPGIPHQFYGEVYIKGSLAQGGTVVAKIDGEAVASTPITDGHYGYDPVFLIPDPDYEFNGKEITFFVNGAESNKFIFKNGASTNLDLEVYATGGYCGDEIIEDGEECDDGNNINGDGCSADCKIEKPGNESVCGNGIIETGEECDDGNLNGVRCDNDNRDCTYCSSSCKIIELKEKSENKDHNGETSKERTLFTTCEPNWDCTNWGECVNGTTTRVCTDTNGCGIDINKPNEINICGTQQVKIEPGEKQATFSALFWILLAISLGIIAVLTILVNRY